MKNSVVWVEERRPFPHLSAKNDTKDTDVDKMSVLLPFVAVSLVNNIYIRKKQRAFGTYFVG